MKTNIGHIDRIVRIAAGLVLLSLTATDHISAWGWVGVLPLVTGLFQYCPLYRVLGINTCRLSS